MLKVDDDHFANIKKLAIWLSWFDSLNYIPKNFYMGNMAIRRVTKLGKWRDRMYQQSFYPNYGNGASGYLLSQNLVKYLVKNEEYNFPYPNEDASIGIWLDRAKKRGDLEINQNTDKIWYFDTKNTLFTWNGFTNCTFDGRFIIGHNLVPEDFSWCLKLQIKFDNI